MKKRSRLFLFTLMIFGYAFLYAPILTLVIFSFNASQVLTTWTGFSLKWYVELFSNKMIFEAAFLSLKIAFMTANFAVILGTVGGLVIARFKSFRGKTLLNGLVTAPLVMPEVMSGLAILLLFVVMQQNFGWPKERGITTITLGHITIAVAYVLVIVRTRLSEFDDCLEEAALDLGTKPLTIFFRITLPLIMPSLISGWLLAFTLSLDDVVIASFLSGPGATTLPMVVFSSVRFGLSPQINALATIIVSLVATGVILAAWINIKTTRPVEERG